jgi:endonuclease YncB( thermonuclease family)
LITSGAARIVESGWRDKCNRALAVLTIDGKDVATAMIGSALSWRAPTGLVQGPI